MSNFLTGIRPTGAPKTFSLALPIPTTAPMPLFDTAADTGKFVKAILLAGPKTFGKTYNAAVAYKTAEEVAQEFSTVTGTTATATVADRAAWKAELTGFGLSELAAEELLQNMRLMDEFGYYGGEGLEDSQRVSFVLPSRAGVWTKANMREIDFG